MSEGALEKVKSAVQETFDGWKNILTGLNVKNRDKKMSADATWGPITRQMVEHIYAADDMAQKIVDTPAEDMVREWFKVTSDKEQNELDQLVQNKFDDLDAKQKVEMALKFADLYGGSAILMGVNDGGIAPELPLDKSRIQSLDFLTVVDRFELWPEKIQLDPSKKNFGEPEIYTIQPVAGMQAARPFTRIHRSRLLRFDGVKLPTHLKIQNNYWSDSVLNKLEGPLRNFHTAHDGLATLMADVSLGIFKMKNLTNMIAQGKEAVIQKRLELVSLKQSLVNAIVIQDDEEYERKTTPLTGVPESIDKVDRRLTQASRLPHTILLGESPSGLGATGDSEIRDYYDLISRYQESKLKAQMLELVDIILKSKQGPTKGIAPQKWGIEFNPLWQMSEKEMTEIHKMQAEADNIYLTQGVVSADEIANSRFGSGKYSTDTQLDTSLREKGGDPKSIELMAKALDEQLKGERKP